MFAKAKPEKPDIWMLFSEDCWNLSWLEGQGENVEEPRNNQMAPDALCGEYLMCADLGLQVGIVYEGEGNKDL